MVQNRRVRSEDSNVHILTREDQWFERGIKNDIYVNDHLSTEEVVYDTSYILRTTQS